MNFSSLFSWLKTGPGLTAGAIALVCGLIFSFYAGITLGNPPATTFRADFTGARWIEVDHANDSGYFRKKFYLSGTVRQAWLQLAATDAMDAYVNGFPLRVPSLPGAKSIPVTGMFSFAEPVRQFDLTPYLAPGQNTITVHVQRRLKTRSPGLLLKGFVQGTMDSQWLYSDASWKAKGQPDDLVGSTSWLDPALDDTTWPDVRVSPRQLDDGYLLPVDVPPAVLASPLQGQWIGAPLAGAGQTCFRRDFSMPWGSGSAWLEINATGGYRVYLNGALVTRSDLVLYHEPSMAVGMIDLRRWLSWGTNRLEVQVENAPLDNALLANICLMAGSRMTGVIATDRSWQVRSIPRMLSRPDGAPARELGAYGNAPFGNLEKLGFPPLLASPELSRRAAQGWVVGVMALAIWLAGWIFFSFRLARRRGISQEDALRLDALVQVPVALAAGLLVLASLDIRVRPDAPFHVYLLAGLVLLSIFLRWRLGRARPGRRGESGTPRLPVTVEFFRRYGFGLGLAAIIVLAFVIRASHLMNYPLDHDEVFMRNVTHGILERGFPSLNDQGVTFRLSTYELVPWPEFFCAMLTGWPDWSLRVPALLFGTGVCAMMGVMGARMFNRRTGLLAALLYACLAFDVLWSRHCFHLQQTQFFAVLTFFAYFESIRRGNGVDRRYFPAACVLFCLTYLSWEGSGFILPVFAVMIVALHPGDWRWLRQLHFWVGFFFVSAVVLIQLTARMILLPPYRAMGTGLSDITGPKLNFLDQRNDDFFYFNKLMLMSSHFLLSLLALAGLVLLWGNKAVRYVLLTFFLLLLCYSNLLPVFSIRYCYFYQPLLVLGGCAVIVEFYDRVSALAAPLPWPDGAWVARRARRSVVVIVVLLFLAASETGLRLYRAESSPAAPAFLTRYNDSYYDYETPSRFVESRWREGDAVIAMMPDTFYHFTGRPALECNTTYNKRVLFEPEFDTPTFIDGHSGSAVLRDVIETRDFYSRHNRVWFVAESQAFFSEQDRETVQMVLNTSRVMFENASGTVYLWDGGGDPTTAAALVPPMNPGPFGAVPKPETSGGADVTPSAPTPTLTGSPLLQNGL